MGKLYACFRGVAVVGSGVCALFLFQPLDLTADDELPRFEQQLFDGSSLDGWTVENGCQVEVRDGQLLLKAGNGWLRSHWTFADFKLHLEWKALQARRFDAGVYLRAGRAGRPFPKRGYQVNMLQGQVGTVIGIPDGKASGLARPAGEWNTFDIELVGDRIRTHVNGRLAYEARGLKIACGHLGLQVEVPQGGQFLVRNLRVVEYGSRSLFDGQSLAGWQGASAPAEACWKASDGVLMCTGDKGPWLRTNHKLADFNLKLEYQVAPGGNSGLYVRVPENGAHHRDNDQQPPAGFEVQILDDAAPKYAKLKPYQYSASVYDIVGAHPRTSKPAGQWNCLELNCLGQHITSIHNGTAVVDIDGTSHPAINLRQLEGFLGLQNHSTVVRYRNLRLGPARAQLVP